MLFAASTWYVKSAGSPAQLETNATFISLKVRSVEPFVFQNSNNTFIPVWLRLLINNKATKMMETSVFCKMCMKIELNKGVIQQYKDKIECKSPEADPL